MDFSGTTYHKELDEKRLTTQLEKVWYFMARGEWKTLREIAEYAGGSEAGVSARLRDLRNKFGLIIGRRRVNGGLWEYSCQKKFDENGNGLLF